MPGSVVLSHPKSVGKRGVSSWKINIIARLGGKIFKIKINTYVLQGSALSASNLANFQLKNLREISCF